ncbi:MAG: response regulator [Geminicoccaceae bacterium]
MPCAFSQTKPTILVVEDSDDDYEALTRAFRIRGNMTNPLHRCEDGQQALDYLFREGIYQDPLAAARPTIILLDLNMPGIDGRNVLARIKGDVSLRSIPVIVMSTSDHERDIEACYQMGANTYVQKPVSYLGLYETINRMADFWLDCAILPRSEPNSLITYTPHAIG